ncbi:glycosyltransferase family 4 protein [Tissierella creatinini]|nr:glycosyltransferase family 4 protein [Tissierella creatinini]TJX62222.1 glycosyltransferase family 4 protein [Soehngenia saccharolytica]
MEKALILTNSIDGLYSFRKELIESLIKEGYEVTISAPLGSREHFFQNLRCNIIETSINRRGTNPVEDIKLFINYVRIIRKLKPKVVLSYTIKPNIYGGMASQITSIPYISNVTGLGSAVENNGFIQSLTLQLYRIGLKKSACVFFQNKSNMDFMYKQNISKYNHRLIPGSGVNLQHYEVMEYQPDSILHFLFIGRVMKDKGIDEYLDAAKYIKEKYPDTVFHILGSCEEEYSLKLKEMQEKNIVLYHGMQEDVREFHKISHCTIHPTYHEGMSNVLLESAACGRPIITTDVSGCREIVDDGLNGYLVEPGNSQDLIEKIEKFISLSFEEKKQMGLKGRIKVENGFDRQVVIDAYLEEITKLYERRINHEYGSI